MPVKCHLFDDKINSIMNLGLGSNFSNIQINGINVVDYFHSYYPPNVSFIRTQ